MSNNEQEPSWGDIAEEWLKSQKREKTASTPGNNLETLIDQNPDIRVLRDIEGDIHIWVTMEGKKRLITLSRRIRNSYTSDIILTSHEISMAADTLPQYTYVLVLITGNNVNIKGKTTETDLDVKAFLTKAKTGLEMLKLRDDMISADQERLGDKVADYSAEQESVKQLILNRMIVFVDLYLDFIKH